MKKLLTIAALASTAAAYAVDIDVGTVGVTKITPTGQNTIVVTSYDELTGTASMAVSNIVKTANLPPLTKLYILNSEVSEYEGYTLRFDSGDSGPKHWVRDVNYTVNANGTLSEGNKSPSTSIPTLTAGQGFWISFPSAPANDQYIYAYGKPSANTNITMTANSVVLVGNPTQSSKPPTITGMVKGDKIMAFEIGATMPTIYRTDGKDWQKVGAETKGAAASIISPIPAGTGFWYLSNGTALIDWTK